MSPTSPQHSTSLTSLDVKQPAAATQQQQSAATHLFHLQQQQQQQQKQIHRGRYCENQKQKQAPAQRPTR